MSARQSERYYWLKLPNDFFDNHTLRILRGCDGGQYALLLYIELLAESVTRNGRLRCSEKVPYDEAMIASMFGFSEEQVARSFALLKKFELMTIEKDGTLVFPFLGDMVGNETKDAFRKRLERSNGGQAEDAERTFGGQREDKERTNGGKCPQDIRVKSTEKRDKKEEGGGSSRAGARTTAAAADLVSSEKIDQTILRLNATTGMNITDAEATGFKHYVAVRNSNPDAPPNVFVTRQNFQTTLNAWLDIERKKNAEKRRSDKAEAEKQSEEERLEEIRQRRLLDENGRDD